MNVSVAVDTIDMLLATHTIVAATAGEAIGGALPAFLLGVIIHFLLDMIPHFDTTDEGQMTSRQIALITVDGLVGASIAYHMYRLSNYSPNFLWGGVGGVLPDFLLNIPQVERILSRARIFYKVRNFHIRIQKMALWALPGLMLQLALMLISLYVYLRFVI